MRRAAIGVLMVLATNGSSSRARAYSDWELFGLETTLGGGGRRYFTGSPVDGYSCAVCHQGGTEPHVQMTGLPLTGYVPGQMYDVEVSWSDPKVPHALQLELVTKGGVSPGVELVPDGPSLDPRERCAANGELERATYLIQDRGRQILGVRGCRAAALHFRFTAPNEAELAFAATIVRSDSSASTAGDGVTELASVIYPVGQARRGATSACSLAAGAQTRSTGLAAGLGLLVALLMQRRRRPRSQG